MPYFTDIAAEIYEKRKSAIPTGVEIESTQKGNVRATSVKISRSGLNRAKGTYITLDMPLLLHGAEKSEEYILAVANSLTELLPQNGAVLVAGIGNSEVTADALGPAVIKRVLASTGKKSELMPRKVYAVAPGVEAKSGISTREYLNAIIAQLSPCTVICIDSLVTKTPSRLGTSVQLSTSGLSPKTERELSSTTLKVPVLAVGVPTMMQIKASDNAQLVVTAKNIDEVVRRCSVLLAAAINKVLYPQLTSSEIDYISF